MDNTRDKNEDICGCICANSYRAMLRLLAEIEEFEATTPIYLSPAHKDINGDKLEVVIDIICNDYFAYACADGVEVPIADAEKLLDIYHEYGDKGIYAYACIKRGMWPIKEECYEEFREITKEVAKRFFKIDKLVLKSNFSF